MNTDPARDSLCLTHIFECNLIRTVYHNSYDLVLNCILIEDRLCFTQYMTQYMSDHSALVIVTLSDNTLSTASEYQSDETALN